MTPAPAGHCAPPLRIGILGVARISGEAVVLPARALGHRLVAVASRDRARAEFFAGLCGVERVHDTYEDVLADPEVDAVYLPLPPALHANWTLAALAAGKHVLCEKPLAATEDEAQRVRSAAHRAGLVVHEAYHHLCHPLWERIASLLAMPPSIVESALGASRSVRVDLSMPPPGPDDPRWSRTLGGGALLDLGCYGLQIAHLLGAVCGGAPAVESASARLAGTGRSADGHRTPVDASVTVVLRYPGGAHAQVHASIAAASSRHRLRVDGRDGRLEADGILLPHLGGSLVVHRNGAPEAAGDTTALFTGPTTYTRQLARFAAHVRDGAPMPFGWSLDDAVAVARLTDDVRAAAGLAAP
ncbi:Gfo/Idh/MocA family protein [Tomitella fengzijianii]|uniref:Gfo/Idh/MocA family oxidoreductase n=1 Tax=Tomitella fengzijianii TaxID=2597660 RepID=A0A516X105_9ACTN|nr:Gfo/Idh/MocA family oxidoreductase [Tomitella fengzijianii]QDQ96748.1 Gfo/Idh/MocA family oxidoreductase [Tomitella fengzijianii]